MMKKTILLLLALIFVMSLTACGGGNAPANDANTPAENTQPNDAQQPSEPEDTAEPDTQPEASYYPVTVTTYDYEGSAIEPYEICLQHTDILSSFALLFYTFFTLDSHL